MAQALYIQQELQAIAPSLIGLQTNVFIAPNNYFEGLEDVGLQLVREKTKAKIKVDYTVPQGYFETLSSQVLQKIKLQQPEFVDEELKDIAPTLASMDKQNVYTIPENYFNNLIFNKPKAKILSFKKAIQYTSAAAIIGVLTVTGFKLVNANKIKQEHAMATQVNIEKSIEQISVDELQKGVNNTVAFNTNTVEGNSLLPQKILDVQESLEIVSDEELETYLKNNDKELVDAEGTM